MSIVYYQEKVAIATFSFGFWLLVGAACMIVGLRLQVWLCGFGCWTLRHSTDHLPITKPKPVDFYLYWQLQPTTNNYTGIPNQQPQTIYATFFFLALSTITTDG